MWICCPATWSKFQDLQAALERSSPYAISIEPILDGAKGRCFYLEQRIAVNEGMGELQTLKTAIHEVAHARLYEKKTAILARINSRIRPPARYRPRAWPMRYASIGGLIRPIIPLGISQIGVPAGI